jgi:hypothetical protein
MHTFSIGQRVSSDLVYSVVQRIHRNDDDFVDGDIGERLEKFDEYEVKMLKISTIDLDEWDVQPDLVEEFANLSKETAFPIVYDIVDKSIIDGIHRANAAHMRGETEIVALVGISR